MDGRHDYLFAIVASCVDLNKAEVEDAILEGNQVRHIWVLADLIMRGEEGLLTLSYGGILCWALEEGASVNTDTTPF